MVNVNEAKMKLEENGVKVELKEVTKNNGITRHAMVLGNGTIQPVLYAEDFDCVDDVVKVAMRKDIYEDRDQIARNVPNYQNYEFVKPKLTLRLSSNPAPDLIRKLALPDDIYQTVHIALTDTAYIGVTEGLLKCYGIDTDEIFADALENSKRFRPVVFQNITDYMQEILGYSMLPEEQGRIGMYVMTNNLGSFGASAILYATLPDKFYMLPSSVHEVLLVFPVEDFPGGIQELSDLVKEVNREWVRKEEWLSDRAYYYDGEWKSA